MSDQYTPFDGSAETPSRAPLSPALWKEAMFLDNFTCIYCGCRSADMTVDHFIPVSMGGADVIQNLVACCSACNSKKGARAPYECRMAPRFGRYAYVVEVIAPSGTGRVAAPGVVEMITVGGKDYRLDRVAAVFNMSADELIEKASQLPQKRLGNKA